MDSKVIRMAIVTLISLFILIGVVLYAANFDRINMLLNGLSSSDESTSGASYDEANIGVQIGDDLKGFTKDSTFFDEEQTPQEIISADAIAVVMETQTGPGEITVKIKNARGGLEVDQLFIVDVVQTDSGASKDSSATDGTTDSSNSKTSQKSASNTKGTVTKHSDSDFDGVITIEGLEKGTYEITLEERKGYHVPTSPEIVKVTEEKKEASSTGIGSSEEMAKNSSKTSSEKVIYVDGSKDKANTSASTGSSNNSSAQSKSVTDALVNSITSSFGKSSDTTTSTTGLLDGLF